MKIFSTNALIKRTFNEKQLFHSLCCGVIDIILYVVTISLLLWSSRSFPRHPFLMLVFFTWFALPNIDMRKGTNFVFVNTLTKTTFLFFFFYVPLQLPFWNWHKIIWCKQFHSSALFHLLIMQLIILITRPDGTKMCRYVSFFHKAREGTRRRFSFFPIWLIMGTKSHMTWGTAFRSLFV